MNNKTGSSGYTGNKMIYKAVTVNMLLVITWLIISIINIQGIGGNNVLNKAASWNMFKWITKFPQALFYWF